jgi:hypothetical protein
MGDPRGVGPRRDCDRLFDSVLARWTQTSPRLFETDLLVALSTHSDSLRSLRVANARANRTHPALRVA